MLLVGCGDALRDGTYRGEVMLAFEGIVISETPPEELAWPYDKLAVTMHWATVDGRPEGTWDPQQVHVETGFPARYQMSLFLPPLDEAKFPAPWDDSVRIAVATPILYVDYDSDEAWDYPDEPVVGGSFDVVGLWWEPPWYGQGLDAEHGYREGYQKVYAEIDYCQGGATPSADDFPVQDAPVHLYVGEIWDELVTWGCD